MLGTLEYKEIELMRPQHGREEIHPGRWKGMEPNNNGELYKMLNRPMKELRKPNTLSKKKSTPIQTEHPKAWRKINHKERASTGAHKSNRCSREQQTLHRHEQKKEEQKLLDSDER